MKAISLPDKIADDLAKVSEELTFMARKPISQSMAVNLLIEVYHAHLNNRCALDAFSQQLRSLDIMPPEEFDNYWDEPSKPPKTQEPKQKGKPKSSKQLGVKPK
jgi:hypothetical protein